MRLPACIVATVLASGCGGPHAEVSGTVLDVGFGETTSVFFGGPYLVISNLDADCMDVAFVARNYEEGEAPTTIDTQVLQFAWSGDEIVEGRSTVDVGASVSATVVSVIDGALRFDHASNGVITVDSATEDEVTGSFETVTFEDGTLNGTFTAEWCRNLRD